MNKRFIEVINYLIYANIVANQEDFCNKIGMDSSSISQLKNGRRNLTQRFASKLQAHFPLISKQWLLTGEGNMLNEQNNLELNNTNTNDDLFYTYKLPISAIGGTLNNFTTSIMKNELEKIITPIKDIDFAITVAGDSMSPAFPEGSTILIKKINENSFIEWGKVFVLDTCNGIVIKEVYPSKEDDKIKCTYINPKYPCFEIPKEDITGWYSVLMVMSIK